MSEEMAPRVVPGETYSFAPAPKTLVQKLAEVALAVERIPKRGWNDFHKYEYATEADIAEAVRAELAGRHLIMFPDVQSMDWRDGRDKDGKSGAPICLLNVRWTIKDGDSGEEILYHVPGAGQDSGDKGCYKALTGSQKYALLKLLQIPTGDDPEREDRQPQATSSRAHRGRPRDIAPKGQGYHGTEPPFQYTPPAQEPVNEDDRAFLMGAIIRSANTHKLTAEERKALAATYTDGKNLQEVKDVPTLKKLYLFLGDAEAVKQWRAQGKA